MTFDDFDPSQASAAHPFDPALAARWYAYVDRLAQLLRVEVEGVERIPAGGALIVANHAFGWDVVLPMAAVRRANGRHVRALGEHAWWKWPFLRKVATELGTVDGTRENADELLARGELVLVLPGGLRESVKPRELRYRLLWGHRFGFIRSAIARRVPIVPLASIGTDDLFDFVGNAYVRGRTLLRRTGVPIPLPSRILPIPHLVKLRFVFGEPVLPRFSPARADDPEAQKQLRREVAGALHELIDIELARRAHVDC